MILSVIPQLDTRKSENNRYLREWNLDFRGKYELIAR